MNRCRLKSSEGDNLVLCAAGYNIRWQLRMIIKKGVVLFFAAANGSGFDRFTVRITTAFERQFSQLRFDELGHALNINFSGATEYSESPAFLVIKVTLRT